MLRYTQEDNIEKILELEVRLKRGTPYLPLVKTLRGVCGLNVEILEDSYEKV